MNCISNIQTIYLKSNIICRLFWANEGSRTLVSAVGGQYNSRYTTYASFVGPPGLEPGWRDYESRILTFELRARKYLLINHLYIIVYANAYPNFPQGVKNSVICKTSSVPCTSGMFLIWEYHTLFFSSSWLPHELPLSGWGANLNPMKNASLTKYIPQRVGNVNIHYFFFISKSFYGILLFFLRYLSYR